MKMLGRTAYGCRCCRYLGAAAVRRLKRRERAAWRREWA